VASISSSPDGRRTIQFVARDGKRRSIRLGRMPLKAAEEVRRRVEYLVAALVARTAPDNDTAQWLASTGDTMHAKLAAAGLTTPRLTAMATLAQFTAEYIIGRVDVKPRTKLNLEACAARLVEFFGAGRQLSKINSGDADEFCAWLRARYAQATASRTIKRAEQFFKAALCKKLIAENPFAECKAGHQSNKARAYFVTHEEAAKVLAACPNAQ
jgi:hypothetical protein